MLRQIVDYVSGAFVGGITILLLDSISEAAVGDLGSVVITGSHGGSSAAEFATRARLGAVLFNDAGIGKDEAGIAALAMLDVYDIPAAAYSHMSARIGDARDAYANGVVTRVNETARRDGLGLQIGCSTKRAERFSRVAPRGTQKIPA